MQNGDEVNFDSLSLSLISFFSLNATEVYKSKAAGMGANQFKQYSMVRANTNDGFVYSGTTKGPNGQDVIHVLKTDDNLTTVWSYYYEISNIVTFNSTKICKTYDGNGYYVSGYMGFTGSYKPLILKIDNIGNLSDHILLNTPGVFLDIEPTSDGGCIAVGFQSQSIEIEVIGNNGRRGLICMFDNSFNLNWSRAFHARTRTSTDNNYSEIAENVTVVNSAITNFQDEYFVMGTVIHKWVIVPDSGNSHRGYYFRIDNTGNLIYENTLFPGYIPYDAVFDSNNSSIFYIGKFDGMSIGSAGSPAAGIIGEIDFVIGNNTKVYAFEASTNLPQPHTVIPYKIEIRNNDLYIFGYARNMNVPGKLFNDILIPFRAIANKNTFIFSDFYINHTEIKRTIKYNGIEPGMLNSWNGLSPFQYFTDSCSSFYTPEMGLVYEDSEEQTQWAMLGYFDSDISSPNIPIFDLHLINSLGSGECNLLSREMVIIELINTTELTVNVPAFETTWRFVTINKNTLNLNDNFCD